MLRESALGLKCFQKKVEAVGKEIASSCLILPAF